MSLRELALPNVEPSVKIIEQPCKSLRFRYKVEGRPGVILGLSSTADNKVPFSIQISGYTGRVQIVVSCVTKDEPYRPQPHRLLGTHCRSSGYYFHETNISPENSVVTFPGIKLQCVKRNQVAEELQLRENEQVDPFITGFAHKNDVRSIDLDAVRLAIQVFLVNENRRHTGILNPIYTNPIFNKKINPDPKIYRLSHCNSYANGREDDDIILLCTKINKDDIEIVFYQVENDRIVWKDYGTFHPSHVYSNTAICFRPPPYKKLDILAPVDVFVKLVRRSDGEESSSLKFQYLPLPAVRDKKTSPLFEQLVTSTKTESQLFQVMESDIFQPSNVPVSETNDNLLANGASWLILQASNTDPKENLTAWTEPSVLENLPRNENLPAFAQTWLLPTATKENTLPASTPSWMAPQTPSASKKNSLPNCGQNWMVPQTVCKKNSLPDWMILHASEEGSPKDNLPALAQLLSSEDLEDTTHQTSRPIKIPRFETSPWAQDVLLPINDINKSEATSRRSTQGDIYSWNIQEDLATGADVNVDSASGISKILDIDCNQILMEPFNISSGDLEMGDVHHLSGSLQEHLILDER